MTRQNRKEWQLPTRLDMSKTCKIGTTVVLQYKQFVLGNSLPPCLPESSASRIQIVQVKLRLTDTETDPHVRA
jgi:hypothetical protein